MNGMQTRFSFCRYSFFGDNLFSLGAVPATLPPTQIQCQHQLV